MAKIKLPIQLPVTDEQIEKAFENTNFGEDPDHKALIVEGLLKTAVGYRNGSTIEAILFKLGLQNVDSYQNKVKKKALTRVGREWLFQYLTCAHNAFCDFRSWVDAPVESSDVGRWIAEYFEEITIQNPVEHEK